MFFVLFCFVFDLSYYYVTFSSLTDLESENLRTEKGQKGHFSSVGTRE
jgi:hypothetical protein